MAIEKKLYDDRFYLKRFDSIGLATKKVNVVEDIHNPE